MMGKLKKCQLCNFQRSPIPLHKSYLSHTRPGSCSSTTNPEYSHGSFSRVFWAMLRDYCCCFHGAGSSDPTDVADRDPVLLVSGIAGSILNSKPKKLGFQTRVWVRILLADLEFKKKLWSIYNPETGRFDSSLLF